MTTQTPVIVGRFSYQDGKVSGPAQYMNERGGARLDLLNGDMPESLEVMLRFAPDCPDKTIRTILVWMQTDFAAWMGEKSMGW